MRMENRSCGLRMQFQFVVSFLFGGLMFSCKVTGGIKSSLCYSKCPHLDEAVIAAKG